MTTQTNQAQVEAFLRQQGYESQSTWMIEEIRQVPWTTEQGRFSFYIKATPKIAEISETATNGNFAAMFGIIKESVQNGDPNLHHVLNFPTPELEQAFLNACQQGKLKIGDEFRARYCNLNIGIEYCQRWSADSRDGRFKQGEWVTDTSTGLPKIYNTIRASVLCDPNGNPIEDPNRKCRQKYNGSVKNGTYVPTEQVKELQSGIPTQQADPRIAAGIAGPIGQNLLGNQPPVQNRII